MSVINDEHYENLEFKFILDEVEVEYLYRQFPKLDYDPHEKCLTCDKKKPVCTNCALQLQMRKHFSLSGIGNRFQVLGWHEFVVDDEAKQRCENFIQGADSFLNGGLGLLFLGDVGRGKTMCLNLLLKDLISKNYKVFGTTMHNLVQLYTGGWKDDNKREFFENRVQNSDFLVVDDIGKEIQSELGWKLLDNLVRERSQRSLSTSLSSNLSIDEIRSKYGEPFWSLLTESCLLYQFEGPDYRSEKNEKLMIRAASRKRVI